MLLQGLVKNSETHRAGHQKELTGTVGCQLKLLSVWNSCFLRSSLKAFNRLNQAGPDDPELSLLKASDY